MSFDVVMAVQAERELRVMVLDYATKNVPEFRGEMVEARAAAGTDAALDKLLEEHGIATKQLEAALEADYPPGAAVTWRYGQGDRQSEKFAGRVIQRLGPFGLMVRRSIGPNPAVVRACQICG